MRDIDNDPRLAEKEISQRHLDCSHVWQCNILHKIGLQMQYLHILNYQ